MLEAPLSSTPQSSAVGENRTLPSAPAAAAAPRPGTAAAAAAIAAGPARAAAAAVVPVVVRRSLAARPGIPIELVRGAAIDGTGRSRSIARTFTSVGRRRLADWVCFASRCCRTSATSRPAPIGCRPVGIDIAASCGDSAAIGTFPGDSVALVVRTVVSWCQSGCSCSDWSSPVVAALNRGRSPAAIHVRALRVCA